jgi:hypothetical protein
MKRRKKWRSNLIVTVSWTGKLDFACSSIDRAPRQGGRELGEVFKRSSQGVMVNW